MRKILLFFVAGFYLTNFGMEPEEERINFEKALEAKIKPYIELIALRVHHELTAEKEPFCSESFANTIETLADTYPWANNPAYVTPFALDLCPLKLTQLSEKDKLYHYYLLFEVGEKYILHYNPTTLKIFENLIKLCGPDQTFRKSSLAKNFENEFKSKLYFASSKNLPEYLASKKNYLEQAERAAQLLAIVQKAEKLKDKALSID